MRLSAKPIASPGRTEKFPPPLMRFLRSNGGSKSTRRTSSSSFTRSSPMFIRKKHNNAEATQEPTSPKVTCMGQVRVKRSQKGMTKNSSSNRWFSCWKRSKSKKKSLFFCNCCSSTSVIRSWFWCCCSSSQKVDEIVEVKKNEDELREKEEIVEDEEEDEDDEEERKGFVNSTEAEASPPKNALFLMRCRSDPCKNSSMLSRFSDNSTNHQSHNTSIQVEEIEKPRLGNQEIDEEKVESCESSSSSSGSSGSSTIIKEEAVLVVGVDKEEAGPLTLTRCKSEPTTTSSRLMKVDDDEIDHQKKRNSEYNEKCPSHILL